MWGWSVIVCPGLIYGVFATRTDYWYLKERQFLKRMEETSNEKRWPRKSYLLRNQMPTADGGNLLLQKLGQQPGTLLNMLSGQFILEDKIQPGDFAFITQYQLQSSLSAVITHPQQTMNPMDRNQR
ncbi:hypothetical protein BTVI_80867 [Pitangus sulphuratus]|nr:hypothetical protein BTVI_80867 [Pitangus sulphuratus]